MKKPPCDLCRRRKKDPPCAACMPRLLPENEEALEVYQMVRGQWVTAGMGEVIDIDFKAVDIALDVLGVEDRRECFKKVVAVARHIIEVQRK